MRGLPPSTGAALLPAARPLFVDLRSLGIACAIAAGAAFAWAIRDLWTTFLFTAVVVFLGAPLVGRLERRGVPRAGGAALYLAALFLVMVALSLLVLPTLVRELGDLFQRLPEAVKRAEEWIQARFGFELPGTFSELFQQILAELNLGGEESTSSLGQDARSAISTGSAALGRGAMGFLQIVQNAVGAAGRALFIPVLAFFVLAELPIVKRFAIRASPASLRASTAPVLHDIHGALTSLIRGQLTVALLMAAIYAAGLSISGVPLALAISILAGLAYLIPFASAPTCVVLAFAFTALEVPEEWARPLIGALITAVVVQLAESWFLTPRVVGESAGLSPLTVVLAVLIGGTLFGFIGVLFALPVGTAIGVILKEKELTPA